MGDIEIERFKRQADIVQLVEKYIPLKRRGLNLWATCPFHEEKTASFSVHPQRQIFKCFGCGKSGTVIDFVMDYMKVDFPDALQFISRECNIPLPEFRGRRTWEHHEHKKTLEDVVSSAANVFADLFWNHPECSDAKSYIMNRGFSPEIIDEWKIGCASKSWDLLLSAMKAKGYSVEQQFQAGILVKAKDRENHYYDRFRDRIIFPIHDIQGRIIGFAGRAMDEKIEPGMKYINTPETPIYSKRKTLYGLWKARQAREHEVVVVEGYTDALMCHQKGISNTVALGGTALTHDQAALLARHFETAVVCLDPDKAGEREAPKAARLFMQAGMKVRVMLLPGDDMDKVLLKEGADSVRKRIADSGSLYDFELGKILRKQGNVGLSPDEKKAVLKDLVPFLSSTDGITQCRLYLQETAEVLGIDYKVALAAFSQYSKPLGSRFSVFGSEQAEFEALAIMLRTDYDALFKQRLTPEHFTNPARRELFQYLCSNDRKVLYDLPTLSPEPSMFDALDIKPDDVFGHIWRNGGSANEHEIMALVSRLQSHPAPEDPDIVLHRLGRAKESRDLLDLELRIYDARDSGDSASAVALLQKYSEDYAKFMGPPEASSGKAQPR